VVFVATLFAGCGQITQVPNVTTTMMPSIAPLIPSNTPLPINVITQTVTAIPLSTCTPIPNNNVYLVDRAVYDAVDAGLELGVGEAVEVLQQALEEHHPEWAEEDGLAEYVWNHSHAQNIGVNPRVLLVTTGVALDWQIPEDHDLREDIIQTGITLTQHYREFRFNEELQANYPQVADAANYALYAFFDYDLEKLDAWQQEYDQMFGELQPRITTENC
jgi:hypothetical protein